MLLNTLQNLQSYGNMLGGNRNSGGANMGMQPGGGGPDGGNQNSLMDMFQQFLGGNSSNTEQLPRFSGNQLGAMEQLLKGGMANFNPDANEQRARQQFSQRTVPSIAERFTAMGGRGGGQRSSAFQGALGGAGADLESQLAGLRSQSGLQQLQFGLQPTFENVYTPKSGGFLEGIAPHLGSALGTAALGYFAPGAAAAKGGAEGAGKLWELFQQFMQSQGGQ